MAGPLTYPPEIVIESTVELPPEFGPDTSDAWIVVLIEMLIELLFSL